MTKTQPEPNSKPPRRSNRRAGMTVVVVTLALCAGLAAYLKYATDAALGPSVRTADARVAPEPPALADVIEFTRAMELVTVRVHTTVTSEAKHVSWRGTARARVTAPVRYLYGVDLSELPTSAFAHLPGSREFRIRVPAPQRLAAEVDGSRPLLQDVDVTGTRLRSRAGEFYLGQAREQLYDAARRQQLKPEELARIEDETRERIRALVQQLLGREATVIVEFQQ